MLLIFVLLIIAMTVSQQHKSTRVLETLQDLFSPHALVIRDGRQQRIAGREVMPGDLMLIKKGNRVAADMDALSETALREKINHVQAIYTHRAATATTLGGSL